MVGDLMLIVLGILLGSMGSVWFMDLWERDADHQRRHCRCRLCQETADW